MQLWKKQIGMVLPMNIFWSDVGTGNLFGRILKKISG